MSVRKSNLYTRTGDKGVTSLFNGEKIEKSDLRVRVLGEIDLLNSYLGRCYTQLNKHKPLLEDLMHNLFDICSFTSKNSVSRSSFPFPTMRLIDK